MPSLPRTGLVLTGFAVVAALAICAASETASGQVPSVRPAPDPCTWRLAEPLGPNALFLCFYKASVRVSDVAPHLIGFETRDNADPSTAASFANAASVTSKALVDLVHQPGGKSALAQISDVRVGLGNEPSSSLEAGIMTIIVVHRRGSWGCPSVDQIEQTAMAQKLVLVSAR